VKRFITILTALVVFCAFALLSVAPWMNSYRLTIPVGSLEAQTPTCSVSPADLEELGKNACMCTAQTDDPFGFPFKHDGYGLCQQGPAIWWIQAINLIIWLAAAFGAYVLGRRLLTRN
jgi:hypothetical protein